MTPADLFAIWWSDIPPVGKIILGLCSLAIGAPLLMHLFS